MKKSVLSVLCLLLGWGLHAQNFVVTDPQQRNVVLEEYTGIHCGWCPEGHRISEALQLEFPGRFLAVNFHQGGYAIPDTSKGEPDFRSIYGDSLAAQAGVSGYPTATVNRHIFPDIDATATAMSRSAWRIAGLQMMDMYSPANVGFKSSFDTATRELTVDVEIYYTGNSPKSMNYLNIALLESHVYGYQSDYVQENHTDYDHKNIFRHFLTGQWGDKIKTTTEGSLFSKTYKYTVPEKWNIDSSDVVVYVTESRQEIYTGVKDKAVDGYQTGKGVLYVGDFNKPAKNFMKCASGTEVNFNFSAVSRLSGNEDFVFKLSSDEPTDWSSTFTVNANDYSDSVKMQLSSGTPLDIVLNVTPGSTAALSTYTLSMYSVNNPVSVKKVMFYVISGVTDLVVNNSGSWGTASDTTASLFQQNFIDGLTYAQNTSFGVTNSKTVLDALAANALDDVKHIYYNVGWSFPSLSDDLVAYFKTLLDNGGNLMISGQDIGWDNWDADGYGTDITKNFIIDYLKTSYVNDGTTANNQLTNAGDELYKNVSNSSIVNMYGEDGTGTKFMYPDQLSTETNGKPIFFYNGSKNRIAAVRSNVIDYKTLFLGVSLEMISDATVRKEIMKITHDWFHGLISTDVFDAKMAGLKDAYPNPARDFITIPLNSGNKNEVSVTDVNGRVIYQKENVQGNELKISTSSFGQGIYFYTVRSGNELKQGRFVVK